MKKIIAMLLALVMVFALVACSSKTAADDSTATTTPADTTEKTENEAAAKGSFVFSISKAAGRERPAA